MVKVLNEAEQQVFTMDSRPLNYYFAFEKSLYQTISEEIINYFATLKDLNTIIGAPVNRYRHEYKALKFLRQRFFAKVANEEIDFDKFFEFYKWFDSSLTMMLNQLVPASTDFAKNVRTIIESHVLERNKYQSKFPFLEDKTNPLFGSTWGTGNDATAMASPEDFPAGTGFFANTAYTRRQIGSSNPIRTKEWNHLHSPPTQLQREKSYWWKLEANRAQNPTLKSGTPNSTNNVRQELLLAIRKSRNIAANSPVRFGTEGSVVFGGVGFHPNKRTDFVYDATAPAGRLAPGSNIPVNIMLSFQDDVEDLIDTKDVYYPSLKQRLGFGINPDINRDTTSPIRWYTCTKNKMDGNVLAPFSLYSSSVKTGYNTQVIEQYHSGVMITNQHHDIVHTRDIPLQGPFTEQFVGGRQHRHIRLNHYDATLSTKNHLDSRDTRPEAWMIKLGICPASAHWPTSLVSLGSGALGITGPQYPDATSPSGSAPKGYLFERPKANLARGEYAKRPVNIRNIQMRTGSTLLGNYEKNYQVVQTCGRELNDPFFNDQSFDFAPYPETLATRGRFPLYVPAIYSPTSLQFYATDQTILDAGSDSNWEGLLTDAASDGFAISFWYYNTDAPSNNKRIIQIGTIQHGIFNSQGITIFLYNNAGTNTVYVECRDATPKTTYARSGDVHDDVWNHVVVVVPPGAIDGSSSDTIDIYVNGSLSSGASGAAACDWGTVSFDDGMQIGDSAQFSNPYSGYLCDVAVMTGLPSTAGVSTMYNDGTRPDLGSISLGGTATLTNWWKLGIGYSGAGSFVDSVGGDDFLAVPSNFGHSPDYEGVKGVSPPIVEALRPPDSSLSPIYRTTTANVGGCLDFELPNRTGANSNQTVIVNRFAGCGYEVMSRGYMDPAHEELSVYNALPYRNLAVIDYGLSGSASVDPVAARTITVVDQIDKNRGLDQRATLHCGQFGHDAAYGSVPSSTYVTTPSWHKTNRNAITRPNEVGSVDPPVDAAAWGALQSTGGTRLEVGNGAAWDAAIGGTYNSADPIGSGTAKDWTIATWLYIEAYDTAGTFVWQVGGSSNKRFYMNAAGLANLRAGGVGQAFATTFGLGQWYHVVCTYDNSTNIANAYVDGILDANFPSLVGDTYDANNSMALGWYRSTPGGWDLIGQLAEFLVYDRALTAGEIVELYRGGVVPVAGQFPTTNLIARYAFSAEAGDTVANIYNQGPGGSSFDSTAVLNYILSTASASLSHPAVPVYSTRRVYDNLYVQHQIPRSTQQYSWIAASIKSGSTIFGLESPSCAEANSLDMLISASDFGSFYHTLAPTLRTWGGAHRGSAAWGNLDSFVPTDFVGLNTHIQEPISQSTHTLGYPAGTPLFTLGSSPSDRCYLNIRPIPGFLNGILSPLGPREAPVFNALMLNRNGPYGYPSWKQIRTGENPVARKLRETNKIGVLLPPPLIPKTSYTYSGSTLVSTGQRGFVRGLKSNRFVDYTERPITSHNKPIYFAFQDNTANSDPSNNIALRVSYGNKLEYFTHEGLNNRLNLGKPVDDGNSYNTIANFAKQSSLSVVANYSQRIYPAAENVYNPDIRSRTEFSIKDIWNETRNIRSVQGGRPNACGDIIPSSSIWPLDGHNNFTTSASVITNLSGGSGELMNFTSRYSSSIPIWTGPLFGDGGQRGSPTYAWRITAGSASANPQHYVLAGDAEWQAAAQSGRAPYINYETYAEQIHLVGKDYSLIPEFRISEHIETFVKDDESNFLQAIDNIFDLTGAAVSSSAQRGFYKLYSNADFLKYFSVVDNDLNEARSGDLTITRDKLTLKCNALLNFLPYKGFYPAERTVELATLFNQSFSEGLLGRYRNMDNAGSGSAGFRMLMEPLFSPGIMMNTIKSGIGVGSTILCQSQSHGIYTSPYSPGLGSTWKVPNLGGLASCNSTQPEGVVTYHSMVDLRASSSGHNMGFTVQKVPFEALYQPRAFFNASNLRNISDPSGRKDGYNGVWDFAATGSVYYGSPDYLPQSATRPGRQPNVQIDSLDGDRLYELAIDNFLCETTNMFVDDLTNFQSNREEDFLPVVSGTTYTMQLSIYRPGFNEGAFMFQADRNRFDMYTRKSAFGAPLQGSNSASITPVAGDAWATFTHLTPPYFDFSGSVLFSYTAQYDGLPDLNDILGNTILTYNRVEFASRIGEQGGWDPVRAPNSNYDPRMMVDSCFNLTDIFSEVPTDSDTQQRRWLIQSKFETPVFDFTGVSYSSPPASLISSVTDNTASADEIITRGMWHQYGRIPTGSSTVFTALTDDGKNSLAQIVGMPVGRPQPLGRIKKEFKLEEAIVAVPFRITQNRRDFMSFSEDQKNTHTYKTLVKLMDKYVFPPRFDFTRFDTVEPIIMYAMEFSLNLDQQDIADIWQNVAPSLLGHFQQTEAVVEEKELVDIFAENSEDVRWMVFKVKKRAQKDYERFRRSLVTPLTGAISVKVPEKFSYNWPYDYCSLVELAKIEETYQWASRDVRSEDPVVVNIQTPPTTGPSAAPSPAIPRGGNPNLRPTRERPPPIPAMRRAEKQKPGPSRRRTSTKKKKR